MFNTVQFMSYETYHSTYAITLTVSNQNTQVHNGKIHVQHSED